MTRSTPFAILLILVLIYAPSTVWAQDGFEFDEEGTEETTEEEGGESEGEGEEGGMDFGEGDVGGDSDTKYSDQGEQTVAVVALPGPNMDPERRREVQAELMRFAGTVPGITTVGPETVLPALEQRDINECVVEPLCLAGIGTDAKVDRILMARIKDNDGDLELATDYFDVDDKLYIKYYSVKGLGSTSDIVEAVEPSLREIFEVRDVVDGGTYVDEEPGAWQAILAWGTAGLAVASLGAGIFFGLDASSLESELEESGKNAAGVYQLTQVQANEKLREANSAATTANIFYGLAVGLGLTSGLLFYIQSGSDVATEEELSSAPIRDLRVAPVVSKDVVGVGASFRF